jgi:hypothetical protein
MFLEKQTINKIKFDELEKKCSLIERKIFDDQMNAKVKNAENVQNLRSNTSSTQNFELKTKIDDYENNNSVLLSTIRDLSTQLGELQMRETARSVERSTSRCMTRRTCSANKFE